MVYNWLVSVLEGIYPPTCVLCGAPGIRNMDLCTDCRGDLPFNHSRCRCCALPLAVAPSANTLCGDCQINTRMFDKCYAALRYEPPVNYLAGTLKFKGNLTFARLMSGLLGDYLEINKARMPEQILPVPLHPARIKQRGFNQAIELARPLTRRFGIPLDTSSCVRSRATLPQSGLEKTARKHNMRGAFTLVSNIRVKHIAIVDDVVTTGNTVSALAGLLKRHGIETVDIWAFARTPEPLS